MTHASPARRSACHCGHTRFLVEEYVTHLAECRDGYMQITRSWLDREGIRFVCARCQRRYKFEAFDTNRLCMLLDS